MVMPDRFRKTSKVPDGITVVEIVESISRGSFGLGYAVLNLAAALERAGVNVFLASVDEKSAAYETCEEAGFPRERLILGSLVGPARFRFAPGLANQVSNLASGERSIVHLHGVWTYVSHVARVLRTRWQCPLVLTPHGSYEPYMQTISPRKKAIASLLYERRNLTTASCLWALSEQEKLSIMEYGFNGRIEVIPNGVNRAIYCSADDVADFRRRHNVAPGSRILLFLSRIARKKNLPLLLKALAKIASKHPDWKLLIAGADEGGHIHQVQALIEEFKIGKQASLIGPVSGKEKACALTAASVFVLPSHSEGLPIAVLEAMEYGKPVLLTDGWSLPVTTSAKFGWRVSVEEALFEAALHEAMSTSEQVLAEMGGLGQSLVREHFNWDSIAQQAASLYTSLLTDGRQARR